MPKAGLEPARQRHKFLRLACLPFHHFGISDSFGRAGGSRTLQQTAAYKTARVNRTCHPKPVRSLYSSSGEYGPLTSPKYGSQNQACAYRGIVGG